VVFDILPEPRVDTEDIHLFRRVVRAAFGTRRKTLRNSLKSLADLIDQDTIFGIEKETGLDFRRRGETLSLEEFARLTDALHGAIYRDSTDVS
jgi:16S rRNA (adenine1518-N6/adenine1519-N6)-dimethyltransferase